MNVKDSQNIGSEKKIPVIITDKALDKLFSLIFTDTKNQDLIGIRINVQQKGCFGLKYVLEYAKEVRPFEEKINLKHSDEKEMLLLIEPKALMFIIGTTIDYTEDKISSGFVFKNPNEKGRCGCGESFYV